MLQQILVKPPKQALSKDTTKTLSHLCVLRVLSGYIIVVNLNGLSSLVL